MALEELDFDHVAGTYGEHPGQIIGQQQAVLRQRRGLQVGVQHALQVRTVGQALQRGAVLPVPVPQPHRGAAERLHRAHPGQRGELEGRARGGWLGESDGEVVALREAELHVHHLLDRAALEPRQHQDADGEPDTEHGQQRAQRAAPEVAQDHAGGGIEKRGEAGALGQGAPVHRWCFRPHRLGRLQPEHAREPTGRADGGCGEGEAAGESDDEGRQRPVEVREAVEAHVDVGHAAAEPGAQREPGRHSRGHHQQCEPGVMKADFETAVAVGLQHRDLLALGTDEPADDDVQQERGDAEEDRGEQARHHLELVEFLAEKAVRELQVAAMRARAAVRPQQQIERVDDVVLARFARERQRQVVEGTVHVESRRERFVAHPQHAETLEVREHVAGPDLVDELG